MRVLTTSTLLGTGLVALAILNFSVLDQIGVGLVDSVESKFSELGAEWIGLRLVNTTIDPQILADELATIPGVQRTLAYWTTMQMAPSTSGAPTMNQWVMPSEDYDLETDPYIFVFQEETETQAKFYRDTIAWTSGGAPGPGEIAVSTDYAQEKGLTVGDEIPQSFGAPGAQASYAANFTVGGIYSRAYTDPEGNPPEVILVGPHAGLKDALKGTFRVQSSGNFAFVRAPPSNNITIVQASLPRVLAVSDRVLDHIEASGYNASTAQFQVGGRSFEGRVGSVRGGPGEGPGGAQGGPPGANIRPPDVVLFANGEVLAAALSAAENAGDWFRYLTTSAVAMAALGIAFVTAAMEKKVRRDVGIRQAVGFPAGRIYRHWAFVAMTMGLLGAVVGIGLVYVITSLGVAPALLGMQLAFHSSTGILLAPIASVVIYGLATLPTYRKVLRSSPAQNLRVLTE